MFNKEKLKNLMIEKQTTQVQLGEAVGVTHVFISYMLNGYKEPSLAVAKRIADYCKVSLDELIK